MKNKILFFLLTISYSWLNAQSALSPPVVNIKTQAGTWTQKAQVQQYYNTPLTWTEVLSGTWSAVEARPNYIQDCGVTAPSNMETPATTITTPGASCAYPYGTVFYKTEFFYNAASICDAWIKFRADNSARVYINGQIVPGPYFGCGANSTNFQNTNWWTLVGFSIAPFLNLNSLNIIVVEVQNCGGPQPNISYLTADILIRRDLTPADADFTIFIGPEHGGFAEVTFNAVKSKKDEKMANITNVRWVIEKSFTSTGPWEFVKAIMTTESHNITEILPECFFYKVTREITNGCDIFGYSRVFHFCESPLTGGNQAGRFIKSELQTIPEAGNPDFETDIVNDRTNNSSGWQQSATNFKIFPNPAKDFLTVEFDAEFPVRLEIADLSGRVLKTQEIPANESPAIDISGLKVSGLYFSRFYNAETNQLLEIKKIQILK